MKGIDLLGPGVTGRAPRHHALRGGSGPPHRRLARCVPKNIFFNSEARPWGGAAACVCRRWGVELPTRRP
jgi:hypothetical protein